jgi:hypothetical protein
MPTLFEKGRLQVYNEKDKLVPVDETGIKYIIEWIRHCIMKTKNGNPLSFDDRVLIIQARTASGKSTIIPPTLYLEFDRNVTCTQPRVATATSIPVDIIQYNAKLILGENIGYQTGPKSKAPRNGITFMTVGVLYQQLRTMTDDQIRERYGFIIIDEAHERSVDLDICMFLLKQLLKRNYNKPDCPFVLMMSATFDPVKYSTYFGVPKANIVFVEGAPFPIEPHFADGDSVNYVEDMVKCIITIHEDNAADHLENQKLRDIIGFCVSNGAIEEVHEALTTYNLTAKHPVVITVFNRENNNARDNEDVKLTFMPIEKIEIDLVDTAGVIMKRHVKPTRKIVLATTVAETGLTLDELKYVVDSGWAKFNEYYPEFDCYGLISKPLTRGMGNQRKGRSGRKGPGVWYPLYTEETWNSLLENQYPEIIINDVSSDLLYLIRKQEQSSTAGIYSLLDLDLMDMPSSASLATITEKLYNLGFITRTNTTDLGRFACMLGLRKCENIRMLVAAWVWDINILDVLNIVILLESTEGVISDRKLFATAAICNQFVPSFMGRITYAQLIEFMQDDFIEHLIVINHLDDKLISAMGSNGGFNGFMKYCEDHGISSRGYLSLLEGKHRIIEQLVELGLDITIGRSYSSITSVDAFRDYIKHLKLCIYEGYKMNTATYIEAQGKYISDVRHLTFDSMSPVLKGSKPKYVIYKSLNINVDPRDLRNKVYANTVSVISGWYSHDKQIIQ